MKVDTDMTESPRQLMNSVIQRIATGPELSKNISRDEARRTMAAILDGNVSPVQAAVFFVALRMKRETDEEACGVLDAILEATVQSTATVDDVLDLSDPYDGFARSLPASPFLPATLAACEVSVVSHGMESVGPKFGLTHHQVLREAGIPVTMGPAEAAAAVSRGAGWAYVDQRASCPKLCGLLDLRTQIVKRPVLTTVEVLSGPVRGAARTHMMTGYVHKPYSRIYSMLARNAGLDSAVLIRGTEGGVVPSLRQEGKLYRYMDAGKEYGIDLDPLTLGLTQELRAPAVPANISSEDTEALAAAAVAAGLAALSGEAGIARDALVYAGAIALWHMQKAEDLVEAASLIRRALDSGSAKDRFMSASRG